MAQFEITDFPEIATLTDEENFVFYVKRVTDGQDYKIKLGNFQGLIVDTVSNQGESFVQQIVDQIIPDIESSFEQDLEDQVAEAMLSGKVQREIDLRFRDLLGESFENPYTTIVADVNAVIDNARTNKKFGKEITIVNNTLDVVNNEKLPALQQELDNLNNVVLPEVNATIAQVEEDLAGLNGTDLSGLEADIAELNGLFPIETTSISDGAITTEKMTANSINGDRIVANSINGAKIVAGTIASDRIVSNSITSDQIAGLTITGDLIQGNTITGDKIVVNSVNADRIVSNSITSDQIAANTIVGGNILGGTITGDKIQAGTIDASLIQADAIETDAIKARAIIGEKLAFETITGDLIAGSTITGDNILSDSITAREILAGSITTNELSATAIDGMLITGTLIRTSGSSSVPRVVIGDPSFPLWYGTGEVSTPNMVFGLLSNGTAYAQNLVIEDNSVFKGELIAATGTFSGQLQVGVTTGNGETLENLQSRTTTAQSTADNAESKADLVDAQLSALEGNLGDLAYEDIVEASKLGSTIIQGGYIKTDLLDVDTILGNNAVFTGTVSAANINGSSITGGTIVGSTYQAIGNNYMRIISGNTFGVNNNLIEWYGEKTPTTFNSSTGQAILSNLNKINGLEWKDDQGNAYTRGTIITGTLSTSAQNPSISDGDVEISTGSFGSNGGQIAINCSAFCTYDAPSTQCPSNPPTYTLTLKLYRVDSPSSQTLVSSQSFTGEDSCAFPTQIGYSVNVDGSFIYYDNLNTTANREYKLVSNFTGVPLSPTSNRTQSVSILTQEE